MGRRKRGEGREEGDGRSGRGAGKEMREEERGSEEDREDRNGIRFFIHRCHDYNIV